MTLAEKEGGAFGICANTKDDIKEVQKILLFIFVENPDTFNEDILDGDGAYAIPDLIDIHFHGCIR